MNHVRQNVWSLGLWLTAATLYACSQAASAAELNLARTPLFLGTNIEPNVFFQLDDSGSMDWESLTFDYHYYLAYWRNTTEDKVVSGLWENSTNETVSTSGGGGGGGGGGRGGGGGGGGGGSSGTGEGERKDIAYLFKNSDRLYTSTGYTTPADNDQIYKRDWRGRSVDFNLVYYNPEVSYEPWTSSLPDASFTAARSNPISGSDGYSVTRSLSAEAFAVWTDDHGFSGDRPDGPDDATNGANGIVDAWDTHTLYSFDNGANRLNWVKYTIPSAATMKAKNKDCTINDAVDTVPFANCFATTVTSGYYGASDINPWGRNFAQEKQNFANWYSYYRKRSFVAKAAIARVISTTTNFRYGLSVINSAASLFIKVPPGDATTFPTHNSSLLSNLFSYEWSALGTPLRRGLESVGKYFDNDLGSSYADPITTQCQQNFSILLSDGFWNGPDPASAIGDADRDGYNRTLADVAKYYYDKDLSPLANAVPTSVFDGNNKQHMVSFTVAFGLRGALADTNGDGWPDPALKENSDWGNVFSTNAGPQIDARIDDLWHAAFNSKGRYIQAQAPNDLVNALTTALSDITDRVGSSASVATNSGSLNAGSHLFQARFDSSGWSGQLLAFSINSDATLNPVPSWEASDELESKNFNTGRRIVTFNPSSNTGIPFRWPAAYRTPVSGSDLSSTQINQLLADAPFPTSTTVAGEVAANQAYGSALLNYLRGDRSNEDVSPYFFRARNSKLGDIVDSDPKFIGPPRFRYPDSTSFAPKPYSSYVTSNASRIPMVYVGANDGMLHGFREDTGEELVAYIPGKVFQNLSVLSDPLYQHRHYVNEAPTIVDAYLPTKTDPVTGTAGSWRTVLAGSLGGGGQAVYALDVSNPLGFSEASASSIVLWEFDDSDDRDLGFTYGEVQIAKMQNDVWAAVFSNGYNNSTADGNASTTGRAYLYIVNIETGGLIKKIDTGAGSTGTPNGLSTPSLIDTDSDGEVDTIYAGDLQGNVWKFDVSSSNPGAWDVAYKTGSTPVPLFTSVDNQPITTPIQVAHHPEGRYGYMLYFGTGKYIEPNDNAVSGQTTQAFYGIWDKDRATLTAFTHSNLLLQEISDQLAMSFDNDGDGSNDATRSVRKSTNHAINYDSHLGWYIKLAPTKINGVANSSNFGEKQVSRAVVRDGRVIFTTLVPSQDSCDFGGYSFIMSLNYTNGGQLLFPAFDLNGDGTFDGGDPLVAGVQSDVGIVPAVSILTDNDRDTAFASGSSGDVEMLEFNVGDAALGRQSWREIE